MSPVFPPLPGSGDHFLDREPPSEKPKKKSWEVLAPSLTIAGAIIIGAMSAIYVIVGLSSFIAVAAAVSTALYWLSKSQGFTAFGRWTNVMSMQLLVFTSAIQPMFNIFGFVWAMVVMAVLVAVAFVGLALAS